MNKLEELEKKYKELGEEIEKLKKQGKVWKPQNKEAYFFLNSVGELMWDKWINVGFDEKCYEIGNCFKTREEAKAVAEKLKIYTQLKRLAKEINTEPVDWGNPYQKKHYILLDEKDLEIYAGYEQRDMCVIYSTNKDFLKIAKERIGEENLLKLFKED